MVGFIGHSLQDNSPCEGCKSDWRMAYLHANSKVVQGDKLDSDDVEEEDYASINSGCNIKL